MSARWRAVRKRVIGYLAVFALAYAALCAWVWATQERLIWFPDPRRPVAPDDVEEVELTAADGVRILAWRLAPDSGPDSADGGAGAARAGLVFCHGNAGNVADRLSAARTFRGMGLDVLVFDYRGYGGSGGSPGEEGTYLDAVAAHDFLAASGCGRICAYGESLGAAVALELAARREIAALVLENPFTSVPDLGAALYPWLPVRLLARVRYDSLAKIRAVDAPVLLLHSPGDEIVPFAHSERLLAAAGDGAELVRTEAGHNDGGFLRRREWVERVAAFLAPR